MRRSSIIALALVATTTALVPISHRPALRRLRSATPRTSAAPSSTARFAAHDDESPEALLAQANALRAEAQALESSIREEQEATLQQALDAAFAPADANGDGVVTVDELRAALRTAFVAEAADGRSARKFEALLDDGDRLERVPPEFVPLKEMRARLEAQWREDRSAASKIASAKSAEEDVERTRRERLDAWEAISNKTDAPARALAVGAYFLPALDILPPAQPVDDFMASVPVDGLLGVGAGAVRGRVAANGALALDKVDVAFHAVPFGGLLAFILLSNLASNAAAPRLARFAARHAIVIDLASAVGLPLLLVNDASAPYARPLFASIILVSVVASALGVEPSFAPGTGQLTKKFTDDFEAVVKQVISATVGTNPVNLVDLQEPPKDDDKDEKQK
ncbi:hypothetical protein JL720_13063 [Aureococcus anophagefferens]|nr:hypothetical protein JL720_13063 [Aureococcus anophagefferens]